MGQSEQICTSLEDHKEDMATQSSKGIATVNEAELSLKQRDNQIGDLKTDLSGATQRTSILDNRLKESMKKILRLKQNRGR